MYFLNTSYKFVIYLWCWVKSQGLLHSRSSGESVTQMEGQVFLSEGNSLIVNCSYETKQYPALFWYVQYPREGPQLLFRVARAGEKGSHKGFEATYSKETTSFHLEKASVHESDSAVYYCALGDTVAETTGEAEHKLSSTGAWLQGSPNHNINGLLHIA
uniref:Ig-like domain-containing protein n=1 Tax=Castor canadensis TaxID=51338 RepID=A0A8C0WIG4_CASCN